LNDFPAEAETGTQIMFVNFGEKEVQSVLNLVSQLREKNIAVEIYPDAAKFQKQLGYANTAKIPFVALAGEQELLKGIVTLKDMKSGKQEEVTFDELLVRCS